MKLFVELCFQNPQTLKIEKEIFPWMPNMCVQDVLDLSKVLERWPVLKDRPIGIFSQAVAHDTILQAGDRLEIYAPLKIDPKEARRIRALKRKS